jgi:hypothetical protein
MTSVASFPLHFNNENPVGDFTLLPPELLEKVLARMSPEHLVPMMLSCSMLNALAHNERIWDKIYKRIMPQTHKALHLAPNPDYWKFRNASSIKFLYEYSLLSTHKIEDHSGNDLTEVHCSMTVMRKCALSLLAQRAAVYVIRRLAYYPQVCDKKYRERIEVFRAALGKEGAIESAVGVLGHFDDHDVLAGALCAIGNLVIDADNAQRLSDVGGIEGIVLTMQSFSGSFPVLDYGCFALCNLGDEYKYKELICKAGAPMMALGALKETTFSPEQLTPPLDLLSVLCQVQDCKKDYGRRIVDSVDEILSLAMTHSKLMAHALTLAVLVCENLDENRDYAVQKSFIEKMFDALEKFHGESLIIVKASLVLFTLFWRNNDRPLMSTHRHRLIRSIISAMKEHKTDLSLQRTSAAMLSDFAHSESSLKRLIIDLGGKDLVRQALLASPDDETDPEWSALAAFISIDD